jgi:hypothetical protein
LNEAIVKYLEDVYPDGKVFILLFGGRRGTSYFEALETLRENTTVANISSEFRDSKASSNIWNLPTINVIVDWLIELVSKPRYILGLQPHSIKRDPLKLTSRLSLDKKIQVLKSKACNAL